jgi:dolichol-phosphate mannosyltransferase
MRPTSPNISVIVPTLNEAENIEGIVAKILAGGASLDMEVIVVDDASKDDTQNIVRRLSETLPVTLLAREKPKDGLVGAVLAGARAARAGVVLVIDADGSHPPEKIPELALPVIRGEQDMVIGSRYAPGGSTPGWSRKRRLMSRAASAAAWPLTDVHDALSGFFAVRRELLADIPSDAAGFKIALEILVRGGDSLRVGEVPITFRDRELGQSKMGSGVILTYFRRLLALSGWRESQDSIGLAIAKTGLVWIVDFAVFALACSMRAGLSQANLFGFASGAVLNAWLKSAQLPPETKRSASFLSRLLFVSLLSLFLRSGVLGTCAQAFNWPSLVAIIPAIVTGWTVLFLGYALFIWPDREQYGSGVRWRVATIGATAYLLALRVVFLFTMPIDGTLATMGNGPATMTAGDRITLVLAHLGAMALGPGRAGLNLPALICWVISAWCLFKTALRVSEKTTAFRTLLLFSILPVFFWTGSIFSAATVLITAWALLLWLLTFTLRLNRVVAEIVSAIALVVFWWPAGWLPAWHVENNIPVLMRDFVFVASQFLLVTPATLLGTGSVFRHWRDKDRRVTSAAASFAAIVTLSAYTMGRAGLAASGATWLPLLPFIAAGMQKPGKPPVAWWAPIAYLCVLCYGVYFYWLAFPG